MSSRQIILVLYVVLLSGFGIGAAAIFFDARADYLALKEAQAASKARLATAEAKLKAQQLELERLKNDPRFIEHVLRDRLHYAKQGEVIFRFDN